MKFYIKEVFKRFIYSEINMICLKLKKDRKIDLYHKIIILIIIIFCLFITIISFYNNYYYEYSLKKKINIGLVARSLKNGGAERSASLICYYFNKVKIFKLFLFTLTKKQENEYAVDENIKRIIVNNNLIELIKQTHIDILLYQLYNYKQIIKLNQIKEILE